MVYKYISSNKNLHTDTHGHECERKTVSTHHNDPNADANSTNDVQLVVKHLIDGIWAALSESKWIK